MNARMQSAASYAWLCEPSSPDMIRRMPEIRERLQAQLHELSCRPIPDGAESLAVQLEGTRRRILSLREALVSEASACIPDVDN